MSDATQTEFQMPVPVAQHERLKPFAGKFFTGDDGNEMKAMEINYTRI